VTERERTSERKVLGGERMRKLASKKESEDKGERQTERERMYTIPECRKLKGTSL
jgi:hypothetical protein